MTTKFRLLTFSRFQAKDGAAQPLQWPKIAWYACWQAAFLGGASTTGEGNLLEHGYCEFNAQVRIVTINSFVELRDFHWIPWKGERNEARRDLPRPVGSMGGGRLAIHVTIDPQEYGEWLAPRRSRNNKAFATDQSHGSEGSLQGHFADHSQEIQDFYNVPCDLTSEFSSEDEENGEWDTKSEFSNDDCINGQVNWSPRKTCTCKYNHI